MVNRGSKTTNHAPLALAWFACGVAAATLFAFEQLPALEVTVVTLALLTVIALTSLRVTELSLLTRLYVLLFTLPFSANLGYLFDTDFVWWATPTNVLLCQNHSLVNEMLAMVVVGLCGLMSGIEFTAATMRSRRLIAPPTNAMSTRQLPTLPIPFVLFLLTLSLFFSWLHAPQETILTAAYASAEAGGGMASESGMNASYLISYLILILLAVDAERERPGTKDRTIKQGMIFVTVGYIVVVLQLLRGDRECAGLVAALGMLYITNSKMALVRARVERGMQQIKRAFVLILPLSVAALVFLTLGSLRHSASQSSTERSSVWAEIVEGATQNTWTAVALNNLGLAAEYNCGAVEYLYGRTYIDYLLSLPPGVITKAIGYDRPMEGDANPSTWYWGEIAAGGMHPVVVPYKNFGIWGTLPLLFLCGCFICYCELNNEKQSLSARLLYGSIATSSTLWFWYGDMNLIRTLMVWVILVTLHRTISKTPVRDFQKMLIGAVDLKLMGTAR